MRAACCAFAISPLCSWRLSLAFLCVVGRQVRNRTPPSLWSPSHTRHQPRPRSHAARLGFRCHRSARRSSRRHPPPRLKKNSILSYCSACAVAPPGECPLGTRFLHRFYIRWHIAQAPGQKFTSSRIRPTLGKATTDPRYLFVDIIIFHRYSPTAPLFLYRSR